MTKKQLAIIIIIETEEHGFYQQVSDASNPDSSQSPPKALCGSIYLVSMEYLSWYAILCHHWYHLPLPPVHLSLSDAIPHQRPHIKQRVSKSGLPKPLYSSNCSGDQTGKTTASKFRGHNSRLQLTLWTATYMCVNVDEMQSYHWKWH